MGLGCFPFDNETYLTLSDCYASIIRRVIVTSKLKVLSTGGEARASLNRAFKFVAIDPKPGDLSMSRLK